MLSVIQTALGGLRRNQAGIQVAANNIANVNTDGYQTRRLDDAPNRPPTTNRPVNRTHNHVDLATELVHLKAYEVGFKASVKVVTTADRLLGELIDMVA